jgi:choline transport protein
VLAKLSYYRIPLSGGAYNWIAILAPKKFSNFLSYITGWVLVIAWQFANAAMAWLTAGIILELVNVNYPGYDAKLWHSVLGFYAIIAVAVFFTTVLGRLFPGLEAAAFLMHIVSFFVILIVMIYMAPKSPTSVVFGNFVNGGGFSSNIESAIVGATGTMFGFNGIDAVIHMCKKSYLVVPGRD